MTLFCKLCATEEGFYRFGSLPQRDSNPLDLRHSPHSYHPEGDPDAIGEIDTVAHGWQDAERQASIWAERLIFVDPKSYKPCTPRRMTLQDAIYTLAPPSDGNDTAAYLEFVVNGFGGRVDANTPMFEVLTIKAPPVSPQVVTQVQATVQPPVKKEES